MKRAMTLMAVCAVGLAVLAIRAEPPTVRAADCRVTSIGAKPLTELGTDTYQGQMGGLYLDGQNDPPAAHQQLAGARAALIQPLRADGSAGSDGKIVLLSIGMTNATLEFQRFIEMARTDTQINPNVLIVDGAQGGQDSTVTRDPSAQVWSVIDDRLTAAGASAKQVQAVWLKEAINWPSGPFPESAQTLSSDLEAIVGILYNRYPNLKIVYLSSRIYAGYASTNLNREPYAYESGFAVRWLIERQLSGQASLNADPAKGTVRAPVLLWGPYMWADGLTRRADGLIWRCEDFQDDGTRPAATGVQKVANMLMLFFKTSDTTRPWFMSDPNATPLPVPTVAEPPATETPQARRTPPQRATQDPTFQPPSRSYRVQEAVTGDQMWITTNNRLVQRQLEQIVPGQELWLCGRVIADQAVEWGFRFDPAALALFPIAPPDNRTTIRDIAADPGAAQDAYRCIQLEVATEWVEGTPPATGTPGTPIPTVRPPIQRPTPVPTEPVAPRSYRVHEVPSGDGMWITTSNAMVQNQLERLPRGQETWLCGQVVADPDAEWGFSFDPARLTLTGIPPMGSRSTIRDIAADPGAADRGVRCIRIDMATEWVEGTPPPTGTPGTPMPTFVRPTAGTPMPTFVRPTPGRLATPTPTATGIPPEGEGGDIFLPVLMRDA